MHATPQQLLQMVYSTLDANGMGPGNRWLLVYGGAGAPAGPRF